MGLQLWNISDQSELLTSAWIQKYYCGSLPTVIAKLHHNTHSDPLQAYSHIQTEIRITYIHDVYGTDKRQTTRVIVIFLFSDNSLRCHIICFQSLKKYTRTKLELLRIIPTLSRYRATQHRVHQMNNKRNQSDI